jgi:hypothetical protein
MEMYADSDFVGLLGAEDPADPITIHSGTGFVICIVKCPVLVVSKVQT